MKPLAIALGLSLSTLSLSIPAGPADACAMRKVAVPEGAELYVQKGEAAERRGELREAIRQYERAMTAADSKYVEAEAALRAGLLHAKLGREGKAIERLRRSIEAKPHGVEAMRALGMLLVDRDPVEAVALLEGVVGMMPTGDAYAALARAAAKAGKETLARASLAKARQMGAGVEAVVDAEQALAGEPVL